MTERAEVLSIGSVIGGNTPENLRWRTGIQSLMRRVIAARGDTTTPLNVNVVFHVPGDILQSDFLGVRTGSYHRRDSLLMVQVAVPADEPTDVDGTLLGYLRAAIVESELWARRRRIADDLQALHDLISRL